MESLCRAPGRAANLIYSMTRPGAATLTGADWRGHDLREAGHIEAGAAHQRAVHVGFGHAARAICPASRCRRRACALLGGRGAEPLPSRLADVRVHLPACSGVALRPVPIAHTGS